MPSLATRLATTATIAAMLLLAGCGQSATSVTAPDRPAYDGGYTLGGGHRSSDSTTTTTATSGEGAVVSGGYTLGGGH